MEPNLGTRGATRQSWSRDSIRQIFRQIQEEHPKAGHEKLVKLLCERCTDERDALEAACDYIVTNFTNSQESYERRETVRPKSQPAPEQIAQRRRDDSVAVEAVKARVMVLNLPMPNGKLARNCTGEELVDIGGQWVKVGKKVGKSNVLGQVMNEDEVRELMN